MSEKKKKSNADRAIDGLLRDALTKNMIHSADNRFRELTEHGETSLTVFRSIPYQMVYMGESYKFVEISGFFDDDPNDIYLNAVYNFEALKHKKPRLKKQFSINKGDIVGVEIGGKLCGYFDRLCGYLTISYMKGARLKKLTFYMPGQNNQFAVRKFFGDIDVKINPSENYAEGLNGRFLDKSEDTVIGALVKFFNKKGMAINVVNWILAAVSIFMVFCSAAFEAQYRYIMMGVAALLPLIIHLNYIKYNGVIRLFWSGRKAETVYHKTRAECFLKMIIPTICLFLTGVSHFGKLVSFSNYFILGFIVSSILMCLFDFCVPSNDKTHLSRRMICGAMCLFYVFTSINHINRVCTTQISSEVLDYPSSFGYESKLGDHSLYYCKVLMKNDECNFKISDEEYKRLENHELSAQVDLYSGILGIKYYDFTLVEASDEARRHSDYIESLPMLPSNPTPDDIKEYNKKMQDALERVKEVLEKQNLLVSNTDIN